MNDGFQWTCGIIRFGKVQKEYRQVAGTLSRFRCAVLGHIRKFLVLIQQ